MPCGDGGVYNVVAVIVLASLITLFMVVEHIVGSASNELGINECNTWFAIIISISMVIIALLNTFVNVKFGSKLGRDIIEQYDLSDVPPRDALIDLNNNLALVNALLFACVLQMVSNDPAADACSVLSQIYFNLIYNAMGASFYGLICSVVPLLYMSGLSKHALYEYIQDPLNQRGLGAAALSIASSGSFIILATATYGWSLYGGVMGTGQLIGLAFLFCGCLNKFGYQSKWKPEYLRRNPGSQRAPARRHPF